jgi:hypothetical protein
VPLPLVLGMALLWPALAKADDDHVVGLHELHDQARSASAERTKNIADIERVLAYPAAAAALQKENVNQEQVHRAVATLDDAELARLAKQARASEADVKGGLIVGILALIGLIVVIIIVVAVFA